MVRPAQKRAAAKSLINDRARSAAQACRTIALARSTFDRKGEPRPNADLPVVKRLHELVERHRRFGLPRLHALLKREGLVVNRKRTERIYLSQNMQLKKRKRKKRSNVLRIARPQAMRPDEVWSIDFVFDWLLSKRKLKCLTVVDDFTKESIGIFAGQFRVLR